MWMKPPCLDVNQRITGYGELEGTQNSESVLKTSTKDVCVECP